MNVLKFDRSKFDRKGNKYGTYFFL